MIFTHSASLATAEKAARDAGIPSDSIALIDPPTAKARQYATAEGLIAEGLAKFPTFEERKLSPGEGKTKIALLNFSSGTTGRPKAVAIPHYAVVANVIQMSHGGKATDDVTARYKPGQVVLSGKSQ